MNQGAQVHQLWPRVFALGIQIFFAHKDFKWSNNATRNAAAICSIIGLNRRDVRTKRLFTDGMSREVDCIGPYLVPGRETIVEQSLTPLSELKPILTGNSPYDGGNLLLSAEERESILNRHPDAISLVRRLYGARDYLNGELRYCLWIDSTTLDCANHIEEIRQRIEKVKVFRLSGGQVARGLASRPHQFRYTHRAKRQLIIVPRVSSERRPYIPFGLLDDNCIVSDSAQAIYD